MNQKRRVFLRSFETGEFFQSATLWVKEPGEALDFESRTIAASVARELRLQNVEIVYANAEGKVILETRLGIDP